jgi:Holliday junction resolvase-like predicted endonuclease
MLGRGDFEMSFGRGCPSWVAEHRGKQVGYRSGYSDGLSKADELIKKKILAKINPELKAQFEQEIKTRIEEQFIQEKDVLLTKERKKLEKELRKEIKEELYKDIYDELRNKFKEYKTKTQDELILLPNLKIVIDYVDSYNGRVEKYVGKKFEDLGYEVEYCMGYGKGHPDLIIKKGLELIYVEVKSPSDSLRLGQAKWILEHKDEKIMIYFLDFKEEQEAENHS